MNLITALEIFTNPYDLSFIIGKNPEKEKTWGLMISRGPEHHYKLLLDGEIDGCDNKNKPIEVIMSVLNIALEKGSGVTQNNPQNEAEELLKAVSNPENITSEKAMNALTKQMIEQIKKELTEKETSDTSQWLVLLKKNNTFAIALTNWENVIEKATGKEAAIKMIERNVPRLTQDKANVFIKKVEKLCKAA